MVFKRTTPVTALDLDSSDIPDASASSKGGVRLTDTLLRPVATQAWNQTFFSQSAGGTSKTEHYTPFACHRLSIAYGNWRTDWNTGEINNTNSITVKLGLEVGGTVYPVLSREGSQQPVTVLPGGVAWFDIDLETPAGQQFWLRAYVASGGASEYVPSNGNTTPPPRRRDSSQATVLIRERLHKRIGCCSTACDPRPDGYPEAVSGFLRRQHRGRTG
jgi:hypothetical protein